LKISEAASRPSKLNTSCPPGQRVVGLAERRGAAEAEQQVVAEDRRWQHQRQQDRRFERRPGGEAATRPAGVPARSAGGSSSSAVAAASCSDSESACQSITAIPALSSFTAAWQRETVALEDGARRRLLQVGVEAPCVGAGARVSAIRCRSGGCQSAGISAATPAWPVPAP
jgi:hypothetical protein